MVFNRLLDQFVQFGRRRIALISRSQSPLLRSASHSLNSTSYNLRASADKPPRWIAKCTPASTNAVILID
jgi:hypothetical protein